MESKAKKNEKHKKQNEQGVFLVSFNTVLLHFMLGRAFQIETFTLFAISLQQLSSESATGAGRVRGYHTLSSALFLRIGTVIRVCLLIPV